MRLLILAFLVSCASASPQYVKTAGVKGGHSSGGYHYNAGENLVRYYNNNTQINQSHGYGGYGARPNLTEPVNYEKGVCYIEVPTASLVRDPTHVPAGNGSRPDLSRIRSCCSGYIRNIHNFRICDPVCSQDCVNGICSEPNTCTCFPDHVKNLAGFCVPTCPIGCQNGQCAGGECICKDGYRLDSESKFCVPYCREQCGGVGGGNCTAPNTCECKPGYRSTPEGSCKIACDRCQNGECVAPNVCRCNPGFEKNQYGDCLPQCPSSCTPPSRCVIPNVCENPSNPSTTTTTSPYSQQGHPTTNNQTRVPYGQQPQYPNYPGFHQPNYPGYQQPNYPGQQPNYPGHQQPSYPGSQQSYYPGSPQSNYPGFSNPQPHPGYPQPGSQQYYPGSQPPNDTSSQVNRPGTYPSNYPGNQSNNSNSQPTNYPGQQSIYVHVPSNQRPLYPDSQHNSPDQRPNTESQASNSRQPSPNSGAYYPISEYFPGTLHYPEQQRPANLNYQQPSQRPTNAEPYYPNSQYYPGGQQNYPGHNSYQNPSYGGSEQQHVYENQFSNVELLCSQPCVNGTCVGRDTCACNTGYVPIASDTSRCEPYCTGCGNGICVSPYVCVCNPGYFKDFSVKGRSSCVRRIRRSVDTSGAINIADLLVYKIPDDF